jgi:magnesium-transporting ATPase (P-type)
MSSESSIMDTTDGLSTAKMFVGVMGVVGLVIIVLSWIISENSKEFIKDSEDGKDNEQTFNRVLTFLIVLGVILLTMSMAVFFFESSCGGLAALAKRGGYAIYMTVCAVLSIMILVLSSLAYSLMDFEKECEGEDCGKPAMTRNSLILMIVLSSVALGVGGFYAITRPFQAQIKDKAKEAYAGVKSRLNRKSAGGDAADYGDAADGGDAADYGFNFEF